VNVTPEELDQFKAAALAEGRSISNLCRQLIQTYLAERQRRS
jgi:hypothetical protein